MEQEPKQDRDIERDYTLLRLKSLLEENPEILGEQLEDVRQAVDAAYKEIEKNGVLSENTAEYLDKLYGPFKPEHIG